MEHKRILLIAPAFFNYYMEIIKETQKLGFDAEYVCDTPSNSNWMKAIGRINKDFLKNSTKKYFQYKVVPTLSENKFDYILLIAGMTCSFCPEMFVHMRMLQPQAKFIMYQWDSEDNLPFAPAFHKHFDEIYSFDRYDCEKKAFYKFLPLFYISAYESIEQADYEYDCSYVGTAHPQKFTLVNEIAGKVKDILPRQFIYHYMPSKLKYFYHKILSPEYRKARIEDFMWEKISFDRIMDIFSRSLCVLDAPQAGQTGLTIRTIEAIGAKKKLITTNPDVVNYDFFCKENILVYDGKIDPQSDFFKCEYKELPDNIYRKYSLHSWLKTLLFDMEESK